MSKINKIRRVVVLDGSNIISGGARGKDVDGHRLVSAVEVYSRKGYEVIPVMYSGTYHWMKKNEKKGFKAVQRLTTDDSASKLRMFGKEDDLYIIQLALDNNGWIVTQDTFEDKKDGTKKERSLHPHLKWKDIDDRTWGTSKDSDGRVRPNSDWNVSGSKYMHPRLKICSSSGFVDEHRALRELLDELSSILGKIDQNASSEKVMDDKIRRHVGQMLQRHRKMYALLPEPRVPESADQLSSTLVPELKDMCRFLGLKVSGKRADLVDRIISHSTVESESS
jgi:hypothetical protein